MCFMFQNSSWTCDFLFLPLGSLDQFHMPHKLVLFLILNQPCSFLLSFPKISQVNQSKTTPGLIGINIYPVPFQFNRAHLLRLTGGLKNSLVNFSKINWKATSFAVCLHIAESSGWFSAWQEALFFNLHLTTHSALPTFPIMVIRSELFPPVPPSLPCLLFTGYQICFFFFLHFSLWPHLHVFTSFATLSRSISLFSFLVAISCIFLLLLPFFCTHFFPLFCSDHHFSFILPPFLDPSRTSLLGKACSVRLHWNRAAVQRLGWTQTLHPTLPPPFLPNNTFHFLPHFLTLSQPRTSPPTSLCGSMPFFLPLLLSIFLSKANTIIHTEMSLYSCIKWNLFKLTRSLTCILELPNMLTRACAKCILLFMSIFSPHRSDLPPTHTPVCTCLMLN